MQYRMILRMLLCLEIPFLLSEGDMKPRELAAQSIMVLLQLPK